MKRQFYPRYVMPAVMMSEKNVLRFTSPQGRHYDVTKNIDVVWKVLEYCTGHDPISSVIRHAKKRMPEINTELIVEILQELAGIGAIVDSRALYADFHPYTENPPYFMHRLSQADVLAYTESPRLPVKEGQELHVIQRTTSHLAEMQAKRRSCRNFKVEGLGLEELGHILVSGYSLSLHTSPSAGGLYPLKIFAVVTYSHQSLETGYYEYDPATHRLVRYAELDSEEMGYALNDDTLLHHAPVILVIAADLQRHTGKYANRGYRFTILEAGHVAENIHLAAAESELDSLEYGGFSDKLLAHELVMNSGKSSRVRPLITLAIGHKAGKQNYSAVDQLERLVRELVGRNKPLKRISYSRGSQAEGNDFVGFAATVMGKYAAVPDQKFVATGMALSASLAKIKAIAEGYERYASGLVRVDQTATGASLTKRGLAWIDPRKVAPLTKKQYAQFDYLEPFSERRTWQWVQGAKVSDNTTVWVPVDLVFYPLDTTPWKRKRCIPANSSGVAAFTNEPEAMKRGLLELLERHALMESWFLRKAPLHIPLKLLPYHWQRRAAYWQEQGHIVHILDMSMYGVPIINVAIASEKYPCFIGGASASLESFEQALTKAFCEAELMLSVQRKHPAKQFITPEKVRSVSDHSLLYSFPEYRKNVEWLTEGGQSNTIPKPTTTTEKLLGELEAIVVRLSPENAPLSVVRVLSERLIPIQFGYGLNHYTHPVLAQGVDSTNAWLPHYFA